MPNFKYLPLLVWPGELPKLRDSYTDFSSFVTQTSFVTQDDLVYTSYHFYCIPETKLVPNHVSFVKNMNLQNWPLVTWSWPDPVMSPAQWSQRTLICSIEGLPWSLKPIACFAWSLWRGEYKNHAFDLLPQFDLTFDPKFKFLSIHWSFFVESFRMGCVPSRSDDYFRR